MTSRPITRRGRQDVLRAAARLIDEEHGGDLELTDVAVRVFTSRRQLQRCLSDAGTTFRDLVRDVRMHHAAVLLQRDGVLVRDVAHAVGYEQPAQFAKAFRQVHGLTPGQFRELGQAPGASPVAGLLDEDEPEPATPARPPRRSALRPERPVAPPQRQRQRPLKPHTNLLLDALER